MKTHHDGVIKAGKSSQATLTEVILVWTLGVFGAHKFYQGKYAIGILYFLTFGIAGVGWVFDAIGLTVRYISKIKRKQGFEKPILSENDSTQINDSAAKNATQPTPDDRTMLSSQIEDCVVQAKSSKQPTKRTDPTAILDHFINMDLIRNMRKKFVAFDVETTGLSPKSDRIIEISGTIFENMTIKTSFSTLINPAMHIPSKASSINGIYDQDVKDAPGESSAIHAFSEFIGTDALNGDVVLVAHNALFDINFLLYALSRSGIDAEIKFIDTLELCRLSDLGLKNNKLQTVAEHFEIVQENAHRAESDAETCGLIATKLLCEREIEIQKQMDDLSQLERDLCLWLKSLVDSAGENTQLLSFTSKDYFRFRCYNTVAKFKVRGRKNYALVAADDVGGALNGMETGPATKSEGDWLTRVYFNQVSDLEPLAEYYVFQYKNTLRKAIEAIGGSDSALRAYAKEMRQHICI